MRVLILSERETVCVRVCVFVRAHLNSSPAMKDRGGTGMRPRQRAAARVEMGTIAWSGWEGASALGPAQPLDPQRATPPRVRPHLLGHLVRSRRSSPSINRGGCHQAQPRSSSSSSRRRAAMEQTQVWKARSLDELVQLLHRLFAGDEVNVEEVQALMESYESNPADWAGFAQFDEFR